MTNITKKNQIKFTYVLIIIIISSLISLVVQSSVEVPHSKTTPIHENTYSRVMRTRTIRCGYDVWPPIINRDEKTGKISGIFYDYMEAVGKNLDVKIEWIDGITYASYISDLQYGRIDAMCAGIWPIGKVIGVLDFTDPLYYLPINAYVRMNDNRFDHDLSILNNASYTISNIDGTVPARIAQTDYPNAKVASLPSVSPVSDMLLAVIMGKADITFTDTVTVADFSKNNPNKLRAVPKSYPVRIFGNTVAVAKDDGNFLRMINNATEELRNSGIIEKIIVKYEQHPGALMRVAPPYQELNLAK
jgi:ABC-type amino acid transport substrate-binding protein